MDSGSVADTSRDGRFDAQPFAQWRIIGYYLSHVQIELDCGGRCLSEFTRSE